MLHFVKAFAEKCLKRKGEEKKGKPHTAFYFTLQISFPWIHNAAPPKLQSQIHLTVWVPIQDIILFILKTAVSEQRVFQAALMAV